ncbi:MAG: lysine-sensitive aspartokinase 3 [Bdellovibrio sp.]|nr:lysine-sensitive aspartokinase 3 [Bdellovibrio sp.]
MSPSRNVLKFGGTSMADAQAMLRSAQICLDHHAYLVVVSATSGTTNQLLEIASQAEQGQRDRTHGLVDQIKNKHRLIANDLRLSENGPASLETLFGELATLAEGILLMREASSRARDRLAALGERMSSLLFRQALSLTAQNQKVQLLDVRSVMRTDDNFGQARPITEKIRELCAQHLPAMNDSTIYVTQGFIGETEDGFTTTLGRGGSDYSAALLAEGIEASVLEIWTDVTGIATTDPRLCPKARSIPEITFKEAAELAVFGAKVLHPTTLAPAMRARIPVFVGSSYEPKAKGTWIRWQTQDAPLVRAMALRKNQGLITLSTPKMLNQYGFLYEIFKIFNQHQVSVDAITTSEISVAMTVDASVLINKNLARDLSELCEVKIEQDLTLISMIGNNINHTAGLALSIFGALGNINVRMICQGASIHNFCFLVQGNQGEEALRRLHKAFLEN